MLSPSESQSGLPIGKREAARRTLPSCRARLSLPPSLERRARSIYLEQREGGRLKAADPITSRCSAQRIRAKGRGDRCSSLGNDSSVTGGDTSVSHIHYITRSSVFLLQSAFFSSFSLLLIGVHACDTHAICEMLTRATFVGNPRTTHGRLKGRCDSFIVSRRTVTGSSRPI